MREWVVVRGRADRISVTDGHGSKRIERDKGHEHRWREGIMRGTRRRHALALVLVAVAAAAGPLMATPARGATFVYVGNAESNEIYVLELSRQNGDLAVVEKIAIPGIEKPGISTPMAVSPDRRFLYV